MPDKPREQTRVVVLGAGLAGMSAAITLQAAGVPFRIFEKLAAPGGHAITIEDDGFRFDRTGHLLHLRDEDMRKRVLGWIGDDHETVHRKSVIWSNGVYTRYPFQANTFGLPPEVANECLLGFLQAHFRKDTPDPKNFEEFCLAHFGEGISRHFMIPYNSRLWGVHPSEITSAWCQRFVPMPKLEDVVAGAVGLNDRELGYNTSFAYPKNGIGVLSASMAQEIQKIELERAPISIDPVKKTVEFDDCIIEYESLVSTLPVPKLIELCAGAPGAVTEASKKLRCTHLHYLDVALDVPAGRPVHWVYVPEEKYPFYRVGCYSHFSSAMAPPGKACLYVELADREKPDMDRLLPEVARGLVEMGFMKRPEDIRFARLRTIEWAYVVFDHAFYPSMETITPWLASQGLESVGRYGNWTYCSMEDALVMGREGAKRAIERLA